jgi:hypothetical protein
MSTAGDSDFDPQGLIRESAMIAESSLNIGRILKVEKLADLPVELIINFKIAKSLGPYVSPMLLARARGNRKMHAERTRIEVGFAGFVKAISTAARSDSS